MLPKAFVEGIMENDFNVPGLITLRKLCTELSAFEKNMLMSPIDYSRHKDHKKSGYGSAIWPCHTDHTEHKDRR
jgi:hypothetical protein